MRYFEEAAWITCTRSYQNGAATREPPKQARYRYLSVGAPPLSPRPRACFDGFGEGLLSRPQERVAGGQAAGVKCTFTANCRMQLSSGARRRRGTAGDTEFQQQGLQPVLILLFLLVILKCGMRAAFIYWRLAVLILP